MSEQQSSPARGTSFWLIAGLVLSLALNAFFVGAVVGGRASSERWVGFMGHHGEHDFGSGHHGPGSPGPGQFDPRELVRLLPDDARAQATATLEAREEEIRGMFVESAAARFAVLDAMRAEPFDQDALDSAFARSREADMSLLVAVHDVMGDIIADLTPEQREELEERLDERVSGHWREFQRDRREGRLDRWRERRDGRHDGRQLPPPPPGGN